MVVLFALLVVAVVGAAVLVALRFPQAGQLPEVVPDHAVAQVPAQGPLTAEDVRLVRFPVVFRGYRMADVDALLDRLADQREQVAGTTSDVVGSSVPTTAPSGPDFDADLPGTAPAPGEGIR